MKNGELKKKGFICFSELFHAKNNGYCLFSVSLNDFKKWRKSLKKWDFCIYAKNRKNEQILWFTKIN